VPSTQRQAEHSLPLYGKSLLWAGSVWEIGELWLAESKVGGSHYSSWCSEETSVSRKCNWLSHSPTQRQQTQDHNPSASKGEWIVLWFSFVCLEVLSSPQKLWMTLGRHWGKI